MNLASKMNARFRISRRGVPHIVKSVPKRHDYSICFLGKNSIWRVFYPYTIPNDVQQKWDFKSESEVISFFECLS